MMQIFIEKEWVQRAKSLVAQTQDDPYKQKNEMSKIKADYIKKRFNKTIPVEENKKNELPGNRN
jgi:Txe/YoeB family toxin of Txe-Axe toxin-antitoxin module